MISEPRNGKKWSLHEISLFLKAMNLNEHYTNLYLDTVAKIAADNFQLDQQIGSDSDHRFGITLLIRPDEQVKGKICRNESSVRSEAPRGFDLEVRNSLLDILALLKDSCLRSNTVACGKVVTFRSKT